jgi:hypothetical protein
MVEYTQIEQLSKALSDLKLMGISSTVTYHQSFGNEWDTTVKFTYAKEE